MEDHDYRTVQRDLPLDMGGTAIVAYVVETDGSVDHVIVIQSSGYRMLDDAALDTQRRITWTWIDLARRMSYSR